MASFCSCLRVQTMFNGLRSSFSRSMRSVTLLKHSSLEVPGVRPKTVPCFQAQKLSQSTEKVKVPYSSVDEFFDKAKEHYDEGDCAQACEKLFGVTKFALRSYVEDLCKCHSRLEIPPSKLDYSKYRKICMVVDRFLLKENKEHFLVNGWSRADMLHVRGWNLNRLDFEDVERGIKDISEFVKNIQTLPKSREIVDAICEEVFEMKVKFVVEQVHLLLEQNNKWRAFQVWLHRDYSKDKIKQIAEEYNNTYGQDLFEILALKALM